MFNALAVPIKYYIKILMHSDDLVGSLHLPTIQRKHGTTLSEFLGNLAYVYELVEVQDAQTACLSNMHE